MTDNFNETSLETAIVELFKELGYAHESAVAVSVNIIVRFC